MLQIPDHKKKTRQSGEKSLIRCCAVAWAGFAYYFNQRPSVSGDERTSRCDVELSEVQSKSLYKSLCCT